MDIALLSTADVEAMAEPYPAYRRLREEDPVHWDPVQQVWVVTRYADNVSGLTSPALSSHPDLSSFDELPPSLRAEAGTVCRHLRSWLMFCDPPKHQRMRSAIQDAMVARALSGIEPVVEQAAARLLDAAEARGSLDVVGGYAVPIARLTAALVLGVSEEAVERADAWVSELLETITTDASVEQTLEAARTIAELTEFSVALSTGESARGRPLPDHLGRALAAGRLSREEVAGIVAQTLTATLRGLPQLLSTSILALAQHPDELLRLRRRPEMIRSAVEELLRYDSPFLLMTRLATEDLPLGGRSVKAGQHLWFFLGAANHDPHQFESPERLDLARRPNRHVAFGLGPHHCPGAPLTRMVARSAILALVGRFSSLRLGPAPVEREPGLGMVPVRSLPLEVSP